MKSDILVSIVVITYNSSKYVIETLESCKRQTYKNIELIVSDDASTDDTVSLCDKWINDNADNFSNCQFLKSKTNKGISGNVNKGIYASKGSWIKLVAGDDLLTDDCVEYNISKIYNISDDCGIYSTSRMSFTVIDGDKKIDSINTKKKKSVFFSPVLTSHDQLMLTVRDVKPSISTFFIRKDAFIQAGGCDEELAMIEDRPFIIRFLRNESGYKFYGDTKPTFLYRRHSESITKSATQKVVVTEWRAKYYIPAIEKYFFKHLSVFEVINHKIMYTIDRIYYYSLLNQKNIVTSFVYSLLNYPSKMILKYYKIRCIRKMKDKIINISVH